MLVYNLIRKKRDGESLTLEEINFLVNGYTRGSIPDYQMAAWLMAVYFRGLGMQETINLTQAMVATGGKVDLSHLPGVKVDKHSTGGVGDKTTLVLAPLVAAAGVPVAKLSGRGLGHTGGTIDKLEAIPGFLTSLDLHTFMNNIQRFGLAVAAQTEDLVPADKMLYALRDVTATVACLPLIASSIMSKKIAAGADAIVLDVKTGSGAFMKTLAQARELAETMVRIGRVMKKPTVAVITRMEQPLGLAVGNALEVQEAIATLKGHGPADLEHLCLALGGQMLKLAGIVAEAETGALTLNRLLKNGEALAKFKQMIAFQQGDVRVLDDMKLLPQASMIFPVPAAVSGVVQAINAEMIGMGAVRLGAGREAKGASIDLSAGIVLTKKIGERVEVGEPLAYLYANRRQPVEQVTGMVSSAYSLTSIPVSPPPLVIEVIASYARG